MLGGIGLAPNQLVPEGAWLIGVGLIMLGVNLARYLNQIRMSSGTLFLGVLALIAGVTSVAGVDLPIFPIALILLGLSALSKACSENRTPHVSKGPHANAKRFCFHRLWCSQFMSPIMKKRWSNRVIKLPRTMRAMLLDKPGQALQAPVETLH
jgi:hypothetical protein